MGADVRRAGPALAVSMVLAAVAALPLVEAQKYMPAGGRIRVALAKQPFSPNGL
jgi:hypothetical protein